MLRHRRRCAAECSPGGGGSVRRCGRQRAAQRAARLRLGSAKLQAAGRISMDRRAPAAERQQRQAEGGGLKACRLCVLHIADERGPSLHWVWTGTTGTVAAAARSSGDQ